MLQKISKLAALSIVAGLIMLALRALQHTDTVREFLPVLLVVIAGVGTSYVYVRDSISIIRDKPTLPGTLMRTWLDKL